MTVAHLGAVPGDTLPVLQSDLAGGHIEVDGRFERLSLFCVGPLQLNHKVLVDVGERHGILP